MAKFYNESELAIWQDRAVNGPYKDSNDAFTNSPGDWTRMQADCATFLTEKNTLLVPGPNGRIDQDPDYDADNLTYYQNAKYNRMMTAAFVDLVQGTSLYKSDVKSVLLAQARHSGTDFSNTSLFPTATFSDNSDAYWTLGEWQIKYLKAYDYLGEGYFNDTERADMEQWFRDGAAWQYYLSFTKAIDTLYETRGVPLADYNLIYNLGSTPAWRDGDERWTAGSWLNNRRMAQVLWCAVVGYYYNIATYKAHGANAVKEYIAFHWFPEGYFMELNRSTPDRAWGSLGYVPGTLCEMIEIANYLKRDGYEDLFQFTTNVSLNEATGAIETGVTKSIEWLLVDAIRGNFMESTSAAIYPYGSTGTSTDILIHYCNATAGSVQTRHRFQIALPASIAYNHISNSEIRDIFFPGGGLCGFPSNPTTFGPHNSWTGTGGMWSGFMFQNADVSYASTPTPQPSTSGTSTRRRRYN